MKKNQSEAWQLALRISRRKGVSRVPIALSDDGQSVTFRSLIRGNTWVCNLAHLRLVTGGKK